MDNLLNLFVSYVYCVGMTPFQTFLAAQPTVDSLVGFDKRAAVAAGVIPNLAAKWAKVHDVYFGPTRWTKQQQRCLEAARRFPLSQLHYIEDRLAKIPDTVRRWRVRLKLLERCSTHNALKERADQLIPKKPKPPKKGVSVSRSNQGTRTLRVTGDEHEMADLEHFLIEGIDPNAPPGPQMLERFRELMRNDGGGIPHSIRRPIVVVGLDQHTKILRGQGDDVVLGLSDGTTITGAEYLAMRPELAEVALFHPAEGAVNLYRTERFANAKQRDLARMTLTTCPVPGCRHGSDNCEIHHIEAWSQGGETNMVNLVPVCRYHNRTNHDDPAHDNTRGGIQRIDGVPVWVSPYGYPKENTIHQYGAMRVLFGPRS